MKPIETMSMREAYNLYLKIVGFQAVGIFWLVLLGIEGMISLALTVFNDFGWISFEITPNLFLQMLLFTSCFLLVPVCLYGLWYFVRRIPKHHPIIFVLPDSLP